MTTPQNHPKVALVTGAAKRVGKVIAQTLHANGMNVIVHYRESVAAAKSLCNELNSLRENSAVALPAELTHYEQAIRLVQQAQQYWQRLDVIVNNASNFYPTHLGQATNAEWEDLINCNLKAPFFIAQAAMPALKITQGTIINITDIHAQKPLKNYPIYCAAKAGLEMLTKALARELAPEIRVNAIAPGSILWPENMNELDDSVQAEIIKKTALKRQGSPIEIAKAVLYLIEEATYMTGQTLILDGGRSLS